ncbi:MAG: succinylglutamate desuccinylase/aspartoacylase family protein [Dehalococcoidia bacterium]
MSAQPSRPTRRRFLGIAATGGLAALLLACQRSGSAAVPAPASPLARDGGSEAVQPSPSATTSPTPRPVPLAGRFERMLLPGTPWETPLVVAHSGRRGSAVMFLGGVHGNEPGGWLAADEVARWQPSAGSLLVIPRANIVATRAFERTLPDLGDLNRLYPGSLTGALPMERMAAAIIEVATEFGIDLLIDMHESWGFFAERTQNGTAFLGQTVTSSSGPEAETIVPALLAIANPRIGAGRDRLVTRDQFPLPGPSPTATPPSNAALGRGSSSLALGRFVPGLTPVLVEMGQQDQPEDRRVALHLEVARAALELRGMA